MDVPRRDQREYAGQYWHGLPLDRPPQALAPLVLALARVEPQAGLAMQQLMSAGSGYDPALLHRHWQAGDQALGADAGGLILDGSDLPKPGRASVSMQRQSCSELGTRARGQAGVCLGYASRQGDTRLDRRFYGPQYYVENTALGSWDWVEADAIAQVLQTPCEAIDQRLPLMVITVGGSSRMLGFVAGEPVEGTDHDRVRHGHEGAFLAPARGQPMIQGRQGGSRGQRRRRRQWRQTGPQSPMACPGLAGALCAGTFVVPRGHPAPRCETSGGLKAPQLDAPVRHQACCPPLSNAGHGVQHRDRPRRGQGESRACYLQGALPGAGGSRRRGRGRGGTALRSVSRRVMSALKASRGSSSTSIGATGLANTRR
jgi:hypothetical protein